MIIKMMCMSNSWLVLEHCWCW